MNRTPAKWLPDWHDASAYPDPEDTSAMQWAWEFLRRNPDYQKDYQTHGGPYVPSENLWKKYNLDTHSSFPDPALPHPFVRTDLGRGVYAMEPLRFRGNVLRTHQPGQVGRSNYDTEAFIRFDVSLPLAAQITAAEKHLGRLQKKMGAKNKRKRITKYQSYLRILDAEASGAVRSEIAAELYPQMPNEYTHRKGDETVAKDLIAAKLLRDHDYAFLGY